MKAGFGLPRSLALAAFAWGFAEATFFFVVPDVLLTLVAQRRGFRAAVPAALAAVLAAALGGLALWHLGLRYPAEAAAFLDSLPAISPDMIAQAGPALAENPFGTLLAGAFSGVPYKVFASQAARAGVSAPLFLALSIPARAARFLLIVALTVLAERLAAGVLSPRMRTGLLLGSWVLFYAVFWSTAPN